MHCHYLTMSNFLQQSHIEDWTVEYLRRKSFVAFFFLKCLRKVNYFGNQTKGDDECLTRDEIFIMKLLLHFMSVATTNSLEAAMLQVNEKQSPLEGQVVVTGGSLDASIVLLNHSCDPNTIRFESNGYSVLMANRTIQEGEEVTNCYSSNYVEEGCEARRAYLKRKYFFDCECPACAKAWPTIEGLPKSFNDLTEGQLMIDEAETMLLVQQIQKIQKLGANISQEQKKGNFNKAFGTIFL